ncbi:MAG: chorismate synthase [Oligosphaeraceae bacterium]
MNTLGRNIRVTIFGESHGPAIGCAIQGLPAGFKVDQDALEAFLARRAPGRQGLLATQRKEADRPEFLSGLLDGVLTGATVCAVIRNGDQHSKDYGNLKDCPRPGHSDYPAAVKFHGCNDIRGGGIFSGRLTAPLCVAGGIVRQILEQEGIVIGAHLLQVGRVEEAPFDPVKVTAASLRRLDKKPFPVLSPASQEAMTREVEAARRDGDSVGGVVEAAVVGMPPGVGDPMFLGLENRLAQALFGIPAVKGVAFGDGFDASARRGSENNDPYTVDKKGAIRTVTNHCGGILGGISTGMPILFKAAFKPTPSISLPQQSVSLSRKEVQELRVTGRHDPCIVLRAVPVVIAAAALALYDALREPRP